MHSSLDLCLSWGSFCLCGPDTMNDIEFDVTLDDGRVAHCWRAQAQEYSNCVFSAGLVYNIEPDVLYLRLEKDDEEPTTLFLRPDEAMALLCCLSGALWSREMIERANGQEDTGTEAGKE